MRKKSISVPKAMLLALIAVVVLADWALPARPKTRKAGRIDLTFVDEDGTTVIPVRVEMVSESGTVHGDISHKDALRVGMRDMFDRDDMSKPVDPEESASYTKNKIWNPFYRKTQFYSLGTTKCGLYVGEYALRVFRGAEYKTYEGKFTVRDGETFKKTGQLTSRFVSLSKRRTRFSGSAK